MQVLTHPEFPGWAMQPDGRVWRDGQPVEGQSIYSCGRLLWCPVDPAPAFFDFAQAVMSLEAPYTCPLADYLAVYEGQPTEESLMQKIVEFGTEQIHQLLRDAAEAQGGKAVSVRVEARPGDQLAAFVVVEEAQTGK